MTPSTIRNLLDCLLVFNAVLFTPLALLQMHKARRARLRLEAARARLPIRIGGEIVPLFPYYSANGRRPSA